MLVAVSLIYPCRVSYNKAIVWSNCIHSISCYVLVSSGHCPAELPWKIYKIERMFRPLLSLITFMEKHLKSTKCNGSCSATAIIGEFGEAESVFREPSINDESLSCSYASE